MNKDANEVSGNGKDETAEKLDHIVDGIEAINDSILFFIYYSKCMDSKTISESRVWIFVSEHDLDYLCVNKNAEAVKFSGND